MTSSLIRYGLLVIGLSLGSLFVACDSGGATATGSPTASATIVPPGTPTPPSVHLAEEVSVRFDYEGVLCGGGFPGLIAYADGTAISSGVPDCGAAPPWPRTGRVFAVTPAAVQGLVAALRAEGVFDLPNAVVGSPTEVTVTIRVRDGAEVAAVAGSAGPDGLRGLYDEVVGFVSRLESGQPYRPDLVVLELKPEPDPGDKPPIPWPFPDTPESMIGTSVREPGSIAVFSEAVAAFDWQILETDDGRLFIARWRPAYPHEVRTGAADPLQ